jgi:hypothetical protein
MEKHYTYIKIFRCVDAPHLFPKYVPDKVIMRQISYQTMEVGITTFLSSNSRRFCQNFPIKVGKFTLINVPHAKKEEVSLKEFCLCIGILICDGPRGIVGEKL